MTRSGPIFTPEFRVEAAQLVVDLGYIIKAAVAAMGVASTQWINGLGS